MKIDRKKLIAELEAAVRRLEAAADAKLVKQQEEYDRAAEAWTKTSAHHAEAAAATIKSKLRKGQPVTCRDLGTQRFNHPHWAFDGERPAKRTEPDTGHHRALITFLQTVTDDEVTSSALRDAGFRDFRHLVG